MNGTYVRKLLSEEISEDSLDRSHSQGACGDSRLFLRDYLESQKAEVVMGFLAAEVAV